MAGTVVLLLSLARLALVFNDLASQTRHEKLERDMDMVKSFCTDTMTTLQVPNNTKLHFPCLFDTMQTVINTGVYTGAHCMFLRS